jgi:hypothetical protein
MPPKKITTKTKSKSKSKSPGVQSVLKDRIKDLKDALAEEKARGAQVVAERDALVKRIAEIKKAVKAKFDEMQKEVARRVDRGDSSASITDYMKQGFGVALGVIAAVAVVDGLQDLGGNEEVINENVFVDNDGRGDGPGNPWRRRVLQPCSVRFAEFYFGLSCQA